MADINAQLPTRVSQTDDSILIYGDDGIANRAVLTDAAGRLQVDVVGGTLDSITVTGGTLDNVHITGGTLDVVTTITSLPQVFDTDDGSVAAGQIPQLVINENHAYYPALGTWARMLIERDDGLIDELGNTLLTIDKNYIYDTTGGTWHRSLAESDNGAITAGQLPQLVLPLNYGYNALAGTWIRQPSMSVVTDPGYQAITDGVQLLDVTQTGGTIDTGILSFGQNVALTSASPLPLHDHAFASANYDVHFPVGGVSYPPAGNHAAYMIKVDSGGEQYCRISDGVDQLDITQAGDIPSNGITMMAVDASVAPATSQFIRIWPDTGVAPRDYILPIGGANYAAGPDTAYVIKVDVLGNQYVNVVGGTLDNVTITTLPNLPGGTLDLVTTVGVVNSVLSLPNLPGGTLDMVTTVSTVNNVSVVDLVSVVGTLDYLSTDRDGNWQTLSSDVTNRALNTRTLEPDIWGDQYLYWEDLCETKAGAGLAVCKWKTDSGWLPLNPTGIQSVEYLEFDGPGDAAWTIVPRSNNWFMKLSVLDASMATLATADCRYKLGEVVDKKMAIEFWFSPGGQSFKPVAGAAPTSALIFGFYLFDARNNTEKRYLCRYNAFNARWEAYNNAGLWTVIATDVRPNESACAAWANDIEWSWQYIKLVVDDEAEEIKTLTYQDTTFQVNEAVFGTPVLGKSGLCPYLGAEMSTEYLHTGGSYTGAIYFEDMRIYLNDLELFNSTPASQHSTGAI